MQTKDDHNCNVYIKLLRQRQRERRSEYLPDLVQTCEKTYREPAKSLDFLLLFSLGLSLQVLRLEFLSRLVFNLDLV